MSGDELAWNERGVARSTHAEWPTKSYTMNAVNAASPDNSNFSDNPFRASSWPRTRSPPEDVASPTPTPTRPTSLQHRSSSRSSRTEERRPIPAHRDSLDSPRSGSRAPPRNKFFKDYQECKMRTLDAEQAEEQYYNSIRPASKLSRKELKERQAKPNVYSGVPLATRDFHQKAAELAEMTADAFHDAIKSHRRMVEHYNNRGDREKMDWHKSIIDKFGSKENTMNNNYSQHVTSHTDPSSLRGYVNSRIEATNAAMAKREPPATKSVGFDLPSTGHTSPEMIQRRSNYVEPTIVTVSTATSMTDSDVESETSFNFDSEPEGDTLKPFDTPATEDWVSPKMKSQSPKAAATALLASPRVSEVQPQSGVKVTSPSLQSQSTPKPPSEVWVTSPKVKSPRKAKNEFDVPTASPKLQSPDIPIFQDDLGITTPRAQSPLRATLDQDYDIPTPRLEATTSPRLRDIASPRLDAIASMKSPRIGSLHSPILESEPKIISPRIGVLRSPRLRNEEEAKLASPRLEPRPSPRPHDIKLESPKFQPLHSPRISQASDISSPRFQPPHSPGISDVSSPSLQPRPASRPRRQTEPVRPHPRVPRESDFPSPRVPSPLHYSPQPHPHVEFGSPRVHSPEVFADDESMTSRRSRTLTRQGSYKRSNSPKVRKSFYDEWDKLKAERGVKKIGETGRAGMGRQVAQTVLPWGLLLITLVV